MRAILCMTVAAAAAVLMTAPADGRMKSPFFGSGTWAISGVQTATPDDHCVIPPSGGQKVLVTYLNATSDKAASKAKFFSGSTAIRPTATATAGELVLTLTSTTDISGGDILVVHDVSAGIGKRVVVSSVNGAEVTLTAAIGCAVALNDAVYEVTEQAAIPVGNATKELLASPGMIYAGPAGGPVVIYLDGTAASTVNAVSGIYYQE